MLTDDTDSAIVRAVRNKNIGIVKTLLQCNSGSDSKAIEIELAVFFLAIEQSCRKQETTDSFEIVECLLNHAPDLVYKKDKNNNTAFTYACSNFVLNNKHKQVLTLLLERGSDINHFDNNGDTCLLNKASCFIFAHEIDLLTFLLNQGADWRLVNRRGETVLDILNSRIHKFNDTKQEKIYELIQHILDLKAVENAEEEQLKQVLLDSKREHEKIQQLARAKKEEQERIRTATSLQKIKQDLEQNTRERPGKQEEMIEQILKEKLSHLPECEQKKRQEAANAAIKEALKNFQS